MSKNASTEVVALRDKRQKLFSLSLLFIVGFLILLLAHFVPDSFIQRVLTSVGSVTLAFGLTSLITQVFSPAPFEGVLRMINELLVVPWRSKEEDLMPLRKKFYGYLLTVRDGKSIWVYRDFDFGNLELPGYLHAAFQYKTSAGRTMKYKYYGFPVQSRLLLIGRNVDTSNEPAVIQVVPHCGQSGIYAGLAFFEVLSGAQIVSPTIIAAERLVDSEVFGELDENQSAALNTLWNTNFKSSFFLPPGSEHLLPGSAVVPKAG